MRGTFRETDLNEVVDILELLLRRLLPLIGTEDPLGGGIFEVGVAPAERGLEGLDAELSPRGGCGNEPMLIVLRSFPGGAIPETAESVFGAADNDDESLCGVLVGKAEDDVARSEAGGRREDEEARGESGAEMALEVLSRTLETGRAGRAVSGGPIDGREGLGRVVAMVQVKMKLLIYSL